MPAISAHIHEPAGVERRRWPVTAGLPFAAGELRDAGRIRAVEATGRALPSCAEVRATWPDGSVRWALLDLQADVAPMARAAFEIRYGADAPAAEAALKTPLRADVRDDAIDVVTGELAVRFARRGSRWIRAASRGRREYLRDGGADLVAWDESGHSYPGVVEESEVEERNALRLVVRSRGSFAGDGGRLMGWVGRACCFAHHPFLRLYLTFVHDEASRPFVHLRRLSFSLPLALASGRQALVGSHDSGWSFAPPVDLAAGGSLALTQWNVERHAIIWSGTDGPRRVDRRTNALGWLHVGDEAGGVTLKLRRPWQSYPKTWAFDGDALRLELFPDLSDFQRPGSEPGRRWTEIDYAGGVGHDRPLRLPRGMARTHEVYLHFGPSAADGSAVDRFCLGVEMPLLLQLPPQRYADTGVFGPFPAFCDARWPLELKLRRFCRTPNGRGILNDGDEVRLEGDAAGGAVTRTTENLAYELPRSLLRQYLRAGDQRLFWAGEAAVMHLMDVDTVHHQVEHPEWVGGPYFEWSQNHHYADTDETELTGPRTSHTWLGSLLDYYFLTGYRRAREVAEMCADYCRRAAPYEWKQQLTRRVAEAALADPACPWPYSTRRVGWALTGMGTYFDAFPEPRFLPAMESLVGMLEVWQDGDGRWRDQIGTHNRGATPFMIAGVLQGLQLYHAATGEERARRMALAGATFLARHGRTREGIFYYKEAPVSDNPHPSTAMLLGPLAWAYQQTGDADLLDAGYRLFRWLVDEGGVSTYMLKDLFAFMPLLEGLGLLDVYRDQAQEGAA